MSLHWAYPSQLLSVQEFDNLAERPLGLFVKLHPKPAPDSADGQKRRQFAARGAEHLIGKHLRISASALETEEIAAPITAFVGTCIKRNQLPPHGTTYKTNTGMEFTVTHEMSDLNDTETTLELTPTVLPNKVRVERRREGVPTKQADTASDQQRPRRRTVRQDERDLRHAYRGQQVPQARKLSVSEKAANTSSRPLMRFAASLTFIAIIGASGALGVGVALYGADGMGARVQSLWNSATSDP